jgi:hypothetical protein
MFMMDIHVHHPAGSLRLCDSAILPNRLRDRRRSNPARLRHRAGGVRFAHAGRHRKKALSTSIQLALRRVRTAHHFSLETTAVTGPQFPLNNELPDM